MDPALRVVLEMAPCHVIRRSFRTANLLSVVEKLGRDIAVTAFGSTEKNSCFTTS